MITKIQTLLNSKYAYKIIYAPLKTKLSAFLVVFLAFLFIFYGFFVSPVLNKKIAVATHIQEMKSQIPRLIKQQKDMLAISDQVNTLKQHNAEERFSIPERHSVPIFLSALNEAISNAGVVIIDLSPAGVQKNKYLDLYALNFNAKLSGDFSQLIKLFVSLIDMNDIAVITDISIKKESDTKLTVELNLQTYSRQGVGN